MVQQLIKLNLAMTEGTVGGVDNSRGINPMIERQSDDAAGK
jgi:hypothetical protein